MSGLVPKLLFGTSLSEAQVLKDVANTSPQTAQQVVDTYFMEHRAKLVDIAAYLDRIDRGKGEPVNDFRDDAFRRAISILTDGESHRAKRVLELFSDYSTTMPQSAEGMKGASGAVSVSTGGTP